MTLISNEIFLDRGADDPVIICYADRQITYPKETDPAKKYIERQKLFEIEDLNATVSFFGATALKNDSGQIELLSTWLPSFIEQKKSKHSTLLSFAQNLREELNKRMIKADMLTFASGFHLAAIRADGVPEFIHFSNCNWSKKNKVYKNIVEDYKEPTEDFLKEHAFPYGWDGSNPSSFKYITTQNQLYRNGAIKGHLATWDIHINIFRRIFKHPDFIKPDRNSDEDLKKFFLQMLSLISQFYENWAETKWVGNNWDIIILRKPIAS